MARKVSSKKPDTRPDTGRDDLAVLHPDGTLKIAGRDVTIREYRFVPGMAVRIKAKPLSHALAGQIKSGSALTEDIIDVLAAHDALVRELILDAIEGAGEDPQRAEWAAWIGKLGDADGEQLLLLWWSVCGPFFLRQAVRRIGQQIQLQAELARLAGPIPTHASPPPGMETSTDSAPHTPSAS